MVKKHDPRPQKAKKLFLNKLKLDQSQLAACLLTYSVKKVSQLVGIYI